MKYDKMNTPHANNVTILKAMVISEEGGRVTLFTPQFEENVIIHNQSKRRQPGELFEIIVYCKDYDPKKGELDETTCSAWKIKLDGKKLGIESIYLPSQGQNGGELLLKVVFHDQFSWFGETGHYYNEFIPFGKIRQTNPGVMAQPRLTPLTKEERVTEITGIMIGTYHGNTHLAAPQFERPIIMENAIPPQDLPDHSLHPQL
ncbi:hypothetical protein CRE_25862 [Caenorhabditis remanei]|uniref:Uncharacterized protein n=1 Tax=Caenorhabditis remanei TaxID=31234 RepID=E3NDS3_CAERE|nr:hypothetical protein CRE_25862 [Caenorhabditis remanei]